jgi:hypothetical protein
MTISRKVLLESLKKAMPGIESGNQVIQGADAFVFHDGKIFTYNDSIAVSIPLDIEGLINEGIEGAVHADEFYKILSKFSSDELNFTVVDENSWLIKCGKAKVTMTLMNFSFEERLEGVTPDKKAWKEIPEDFIEAVGTCKMLGNKTPMSGIYFGSKGVYSTDGFQINRYIFKDENEVPVFWISDNSANELLKFTGIKKIQLQGNWVHFESDDNSIFSIKTLDAQKFPIDTIEKLMETGEPKKDDLKATFPEELFAAIDRADAFSMEISDHSAIRITLSSEKIEVSTERNSGKYVEKVAWGKDFKEKIEPIVMYVDPVMMSFVAKKSLKFYLSKITTKKGKVVPRLMFVSDNSQHLMTTFSVKEE